MLKSNLQNSFQRFCKDKKFEINDQQLKVLVSLEKKVLIEFICVLPMPSRSIKFFNNFFLFFKLNNFINSLIVQKKLARIFAFSKPICLIPIE